MRHLARRGHGAGRGRVHIENPMKDMPAGLPAPARPAANRDASGKLLPGDGTKALAREGGKARASSIQLAQLLGLWDCPEDHAWAPYARLAREWRDEHMARLADTVGAGEVGPGPAAIVSSAALQLAASRWYFDRGAAAGDAKMLAQASSLANDSRQNLLAAHTECVLEGQSRPKGSRADQLRAEFRGEK